MSNVRVYTGPSPTVGEQPVEYVERKGVGHPDSICDAVMESAAVALNQAYLERAGRVLHYNLDKGLLVAGETKPALGGGQVVAPIRLIAGDRATRAFNGSTIPVDEIVESAAADWLRENLRFVVPEQHVAFQSEIKPGSAELAGIFDRETAVANDTSVAVGYAPLTETERLVLEAEHFLNSADFKARFPCAGEDVKVMAARHDRQLCLTVAVAIVDRFVPSVRSYFDQKAAIGKELQRHLQVQASVLDTISVDINTLDDESRGQNGMYLTVLGTSAESGDGGEVGRGNAVNGLIALNRPTSNEAAAGKNATCHVGKIYNLLSYEIAKEIHHQVEGLREVYVWLCSQIGRPLDQPWSVSAKVVLQDDATLGDVETPIAEIIHNRLASIESFTARLVRGDVPVC